MGIFFGRNDDPGHSGTIRMVKDGNGVQHNYDPYRESDPRRGQQPEPTADTKSVTSEFRGDSGPTVLDLTQSVGRIEITIDPKAVRPEIVVRTDSDRGPSADAVRNATFSQQGARVTVNVPVEAGAGGTVISGNTMTISNGDIVFGNTVGGRVIVNGVDVTEAVRKGQAAAGTSEVVTEAILAPGSGVRINTRSAVTVVKGAAESIDFSATSGSITAETAGEFLVDMSSGSAKIDRVLSTLDVQMSSGNLRVNSYSGSSGKVRLSSGNANIHATDRSSGSLTVSLSSGNANVTGARHLDTSRSRVTSGRLSIH